MQLTLDVHTPHILKVTTSGIRVRPATATTTVAQRRADTAAPKGGSATGSKGGSKLRELKIGKWNVQALGWGLHVLQMLLRADCLDEDGNVDLGICIAPNKE